MIIFKTNNFFFCSTIIPRAFAQHPLYLSPNYEQIEYSSHYFNKAKTFKTGQINTHQIGQKYLPQFLIQQIEKDKTNFVKTKQFIFVGRSNVGKSSLINQIFNDKSVAKVSRTPGTTKFLHFHEGIINKQKILICDAPGYGFAKINKAKRQMYAGLVDEYLKISSRLCQIFFCINFQHGLKSTDITALEHMSKYNINIQLILCKTDKVNQKNFLPQLKSINQHVRRLQLNNINDRILACSSKNKFGINYLQAKLVQAFQKNKTRNIDNNEQLLIDYLKNTRVQPKNMTLPQSTISKPHIVRKLIYNSKLTKFLI